MAYHYTSVVPTDIALADLGENIKSHPCQFGMTLTHFSKSVRELSKRAAKAAGLDPDEIQKVTEYKNLQTYHISYENDVRRRLKAKGLDPDSFDADAPKGFEWLPGWSRVFLRGLADPTNIALRGYVDRRPEQPNPTRTRSVFLINGKIADAADDALIRSCCTNKTSGLSAKQLAAGLAPDEIVMPRSFGVSGIVGFHYTDLDVGMTFDDICSALA